MMYDVMVREGYNEKGKQIVNVYRYHDTILNMCLRNIQNAGAYIYAVTALHMTPEQKEKRRIEKMRDQEQEMVHSIDEADTGE